MAREFDAATLEKVRDSMVTGSWMDEKERERLEKKRSPTNWCRGNINKSISRIRSMFRWAVLKKIVPASVVTDLECFSGPTLTKGVERRNIEGVTVPVTTPARTVVDCFVYRNKIGLDVALEALRDCWRKKRATMDELHRAAQARRMTTVMRPYLESLT